ncbi:MAG: hypothetical protein CMO74_14680 [Verrucomicrobiales bacterium]|nr:hypothetical protein [Verrucomicrobiales bacterium]|tara:strand:- start:18 stop:215 length:198 start_codon:yes stop_codon:yes gene_type:complete
MYIPQTPALIDAKIAQKKKALSEWKEKLNKSRKQSLLVARALQVKTLEEELQTLRTVRAVRLARC